jgi:hypothetical protein
VTLGAIGLVGGALICARLAAEPADGVLYYIGPLFGFVATVHFGPM